MNHPYEPYDEDDERQSTCQCCDEEFDFSFRAHIEADEGGRYFKAPDYCRECEPAGCTELLPQCKKDDDEFAGIMDGAEMGGSD